MSNRFWLVVLFAFGCRDEHSKSLDEVIDLDDDGFVSTEDCDDTDPLVNPDADELCDGIDNNCDGEIDGTWATDAALWYADGDGDGYGTARLELRACEAPSGHVSNGDDCDDSNASVHPLATELCNDLDDDCDGSTDEDAEDALEWVQDADGDGFANLDSLVAACEAPDGFLAAADSLETDCNDLSADVYPGATELCNDRDDDCDGVVDEDDAEDAPTWYPDLDRDGYGDPLFPAAACTAPSGHLAVAGDCDDTSLWVNPGALESCDGIDNDCDGAIDAYADGTPTYDATEWYLDADGDGYADEALVLMGTACDNPSPGIAIEVAPGDIFDCDDTDNTVSPDATEVCDEVDNDCDGTVDGASATDALTWYKDVDQDTYGDATVTLLACATDDLTGFVDNADDCNDNNSQISPDADELCDGGIDTDCNAATTDDADAIDTLSWFPDVDGDGFGDKDEPETKACVQPASNMVSNSDDCDDTEALAWTGALEYCDGVDNDCDDDTDEDDAEDATLWYPDLDGDSYGDDTHPGQLACTAPSGWVDNQLDCDDTRDVAWTGADERCDGVDNDCDGDTDDADTDVIATTFYADADDDGYGDEDNTIYQCTQPSGYVTDDTDCDDSKNYINPGAAELCDDEDNDCDTDIDEAGATDEPTWYADVDEDGFGDADTTIVSCTQPSGYIALHSSGEHDCDDSKDYINPEAQEQCDSFGLDEDCDGLANNDDADDAIGATQYFADTDSDSYGDDAAARWACTQPSGYVTDDTDCDDTRAYVYPGASEICNDLDEDCNDSPATSSLVGVTTDGGTTWTDVTTTFSSANAYTLPGTTTELAFCEGTWLPRITVSSGQSLTITGYGDAANVKLSGSANDQIIYNTSGDVTLTNVTLRDGYASGYGGAIYSSGGKLTAIGVVFEDNEAGSVGGAIYARSTELFLDGCELTGNHAGGRGGGIYASENDVVLREVDFYNNSAHDDGGAIRHYNGSSARTLTWTGGLASGNQAGDNGGAIAGYLSNVELLSNSTEDIDGVTLDGNISTEGGAIYLNDGSLLLSNSVLSGNGAFTNGGAVFVSGTSDITCISNASSAEHGMVGNLALDSGGAVYSASAQTIDSTDCDWGDSDGGNDNSPEDFDIDSDTTADYGNNETFDKTFTNPSASPP